MKYSLLCGVQHGITKRRSCIPKLQGEVTVKLTEGELADVPGLNFNTSFDPTNRGILVQDAHYFGIRGLVLNRASVSIMDPIGNRICSSLCTMLLSSHTFGWAWVPLLETDVVGLDGGRGLEHAVTGNSECLGRQCIWNSYVEGEARIILCTREQEFTGLLSGSIDANISIRC